MECRSAVKIILFHFRDEEIIPSTGKGQEVWGGKMGLNNITDAGPEAPGLGLEAGPQGRRKNEGWFWDFELGSTSLLSAPLYAWIA